MRKVSTPKRANKLEYEAVFGSGPAGFPQVHLLHENNSPGRSPSGAWDDHHPGKNSGRGGGLAELGLWGEGRNSQRVLNTGLNKRNGTRKMERIKTHFQSRGLISRRNQ